MSTIAVEQSITLKEMITTSMDNTTNDCWKFYLFGKYSTKRIYNELLGNPPDAAKPFQWIWKSSCLPKHKFFFWLLLQDRLNTRDLLTRNFFYIENKKCELCDDEPNEHLTRLFFSCDFSQNFWMALGFEWNTDLDIINMLMDGKQRTTSACFKETLLAGCWSIWKHKNSIIFYHKPRSITYALCCFKEHFGMIMKKARPTLKDGMQDWLDTL